MFEFFDRHLPKEWEIYIQPHLNGLRPDFVLLNPGVGIAVFEVKSWNLAAMKYWTEKRSGLPPALFASSRGGGKFPIKHKNNPIAKVEQYKAGILDLYCPRLGIKLADDKNAAAAITAGVIMTEATTEQVVRLLNPIRDGFAHNSERAKRYYPLTGKDALDRNLLFQIFPESQRTRSNYMTDQMAADLRSWLVEPDHAMEQRQPLSLDSKQRSFALTRTDSGYRRIKGPVGSGKSLVLASRTAELASQGKEVLVVSFNITLLHYLRDLAVRYPVLRSRINSHVTWCHFHGWCRRVCEEADLYAEYKSLMQQNPIQAFSNGNSDSAILEEDLPDLVARAIDCDSDVTTYDAIMVDEGQDFNLKWWNVLRKVLRPGGEMLLVADETQDLYGRAKAWTDESMRGAGFAGGDWARLDRCYRLPPLLIPHLRRFAEVCLPNSNLNLPIALQTELEQFTPRMRWLQVAQGQDVEQICAEAVLRTPIFADPQEIGFSDVTLLVESNEQGLSCVNLLNDKGIRVAHTFGESRQQSRRRKLGFYMGDARVKATTIHSFKGWESRAIVLCVDRANSLRDLIGIYVGLSRLKRHELGSYLTVVCSAPGLAEYGRTWPQFDFVTSAGF